VRAVPKLRLPGPWTDWWRVLAPPLDIDGPRVRAAVAWALVTFVACTAGTFALALVFAFVAFVAASQSCAAWRRAGPARRPYAPVATGGAVVLALSAMKGAAAVAAAIVLIGAASFVVSRVTFGGRRHDALLTAGIAAAAGASAAGVIAVRETLGFAAALVLLADVHFVEASGFLIGVGARHRWEAPIAGAASVAAMSLAASAVLVPPFRGASAWLVGAAAIALTPIGRRLASVVLPEPDAFAPALRRIDGFLVTAAAWLALLHLLVL
jgi:hypothetical protein